MTVFSVRVDPASRLAFVTWTDAEPQLHLWREAFERVMQHPDFEPGFGVISDRRSLTRSPNADFVRGVVGLLSTYSASGRFFGRFATVVEPSQLAVFGMGRMTEILGEQESIQFRVFTDLALAVDWASGSDRRQDIRA